MQHGAILIDPAVDVVTEENGNVRFLTPHGEIPMADPFGLVKRLAMQCRSGANGEELTDSCTCEAERTAMSQLIEALKMRRVLVDQAPLARHDVLGEWLRHHAGAPSKPLPAVQIEGEGYVADALRAKLASAGFATGDGCLIAASDVADMEALRAFNSLAVAERRPFLPVWLDRSCVRWGPMVLPGATGCLECLWHREQAASRTSYFSRRINEMPLSVSPILADLAAVMASGELLRWAHGGHATADIGMAWHFDFLEADMSGGRVLRLPRCPVCGVPS